MYLVVSSAARLFDTNCGVVALYTVRIIGGMEQPWWQRAKQRAKDKGLSQEALKEVLGVETRGAVGHYMTGRRDPTPDQLVALAKVLDWTLDELLTGKKHPDPDDLALAWFINRLSPDERAVLKAMLDPMDKSDQIS